MVISAVGTPPSAVTVTVTSAGSGCADVNSRSSRRCSLTSVPTGKADCRRTASRFSRCSVLTEDLPSVGLVWQRPGSPAHVNPLLKFPCRQAGHCQACRQADEETSPDHDDSHDRHRRPDLPRTAVNVLASGQVLGTPTLFIDGVVHRAGYDPPTLLAALAPVNRSARMPWPSGGGTVPATS